MSEWWTYTLSDFLMFSPRVYYRLFEIYNSDVWPAQLLMAGLGGLIAYLLLRRSGTGGRLVFAILGAVWIWIAGAFFWERYATINWAAAYLVPAIALQGVALIWFGTIRGRLGFQQSRNAFDLAAVVLFAAALLLYPLIAPLMGRDWAAAEIFGLAPDPTAVATLAVLARTAGRVRWLLSIVPVLWCAVSAVTLWAMGAADFFIPVAGAAAALGVGLASAMKRPDALRSAPASR